MSGLSVVGVGADGQPVHCAEVTLGVLLVDLGHQPLRLAGLLLRAQTHGAVASHHHLGAEAWKET